MTLDKTFDIPPASKKETVAQWQGLLNFCTSARYAQRERVLALEKFAKRVRMYKWPLADFMVNGEPFTEERLGKLRHEVYFRGVEHEWQEIEASIGESRLSHIDRIRIYIARGGLNEDDLRRIEREKGKDTEFGITSGDIDIAEIDGCFGALQPQLKEFRALYGKVNFETERMETIDRLFKLVSSCLHLFVRAQMLSEQGAKHPRKTLRGELFGAELAVGVTKEDLIYYAERIAQYRIDYYFKIVVGSDDPRKVRNAIEKIEETCADTEQSLIHYGMSKRNVALLGARAQWAEDQLRLP